MKLRLVGSPGFSTSMKTEISDFCKVYGGVLAPLNDVLHRTMDSIQRDARQEQLQPALTGLTDIQHRLRTLLDKVEGQQAFLLIFGPLKSGKSTLMNALSSAYVSEVTSLPAYPCLVFVSYGETQAYTITRYNGRKNTLTSNSVMHELISDAHANLAGRIRQIEADGHSFDPALHYPEAIRRIDIQIPAPNLRGSSTVLVDTPGLYSRMRFGYDLLTREFRNSAACAVFVVKTDNLFLDHVFVEFNDLLSLFSRIFLVVNIDSNKKDLRADGTLQPSMESQQPERLIEAFESLAMSAPLRRAAQEGRLRIYPIDLLQAASHLLTASQIPPAPLPQPAQIPAPSTAPAPKPPKPMQSAPSTLPEPTAPDDELDEDSPSAFYYSEAERARQQTAVPTAGDASAEGQDAPSGSPMAWFQKFVTDLTDYLNSSDYLAEFMRDTLRQGATLCEEIRQNDFVGIVELDREKEQLQGRMTDLSSRIQAVEQLHATDWRATFERVTRENDKGAAQLAHRTQDRLSQSLLRSLDDWLGKDQSLLDLEQAFFNPILDQTAGSILSETQTRVRSLVSTPSGGADLFPDSVRNLDRIAFSLDAVRREALEKWEKERPIESCQVKVSPEEVPVRKTIADWLLFRSQSSVRKRLFGSDGRKTIPPEIKKKRLEVDGQLALKGMITNHLNEKFPAIPRRCSNQLLQSYIETFSVALGHHLAEAHALFLAEKEALQKEIEANAEVALAIEQLTDRAAGVTQSIRKLMVQFKCAPAQTSPDPHR